MAVSIRPLTIARRVLDIVLIGSLVLGLATVGIARLMPLTGHQTLVVTGSSMEPTIPLGAAVIDEVVPPTELRVGDVVSLATGPNLQTVFTHRITRLITRFDGLWVETRGDANLTVDPSITPTANVLGRVVVEIPGVGYALKFLALPTGLAASICFVGLLLALSWLLDSIDRGRRARRTPATPGMAEPVPEGHAARTGDPSHSGTTGGASRRSTSPRKATTERSTAARSHVRRLRRIRHAIAPRSAAAVQALGS